MPTGSFIFYIYVKRKNQRYFELKKVDNWICVGTDLNLDLNLWSIVDLASMRFDVYNTISWLE